MISKAINPRSFLKPTQKCEFVNIYRNSLGASVTINQKPFIMENESRMMMMMVVIRRNNNLHC
jgi:hypothetical protein